MTISTVSWTLAGASTSDDNPVPAPFGGLKIIALQGRIPPSPARRA
jgi:hypothetical protein